MIDSLYMVVYMNNLESIKKAGTNQDVDINEMDRLGRTPLQVACYFGIYQVTRILLENDAVIVKGVFIGSKMVGMGIPNMK